MNFSFLNLGGQLASLSEWGIVLIFLAVAFIYGLAMGRSRLTTIILGVYFSFIIVGAIPWKELSFLGTGAAPDSTVLIFIFLALILGFYFLIPHSALRTMLKIQGRRSSSWWQTLILSVLQIGLILEIVVGFLPTKVTADLSPATQTFSSATGRILAGWFCRFWPLCSFVSGITT